VHEKSRRHECRRLDLLSVCLTTETSLLVCSGLVNYRRCYERTSLVCDALSSERLYQHGHVGSTVWLGVRKKIELLRSFQRVASGLGIYAQHLRRRRCVERWTFRVLRRHCERLRCQKTLVYVTSDLPKFYSERWPSNSRCVAHSAAEPESNKSLRFSFVFSRLFCFRHAAMAGWFPLSKTSGTSWPSKSRGRVYWGCSSNRLPRENESSQLLSSSPKTPGTILTKLSINTIEAT